jgi:hypothetical protein
MKLPNTGTAVLAELQSLLTAQFCLKAFEWPCKVEGGNRAWRRVLFGGALWVASRDFRLVIKTIEIANLIKS